MAWNPLPTNYTDASWSGLKKYTQVANEDGTISFEDETVYTNKENSFFGAADANAMNTAINALMANAWSEVSLSDFADMVTIPDDTGDYEDVFTASIQYNAVSKMVRVHFLPAEITMNYSTGHTLGTIKSPYLPAFEQYGIAIFTGSGGYIDLLVRPVKVEADGKITIDSCGQIEGIDKILSMDITYITA